MDGSSVQEIRKAAAMKTKSKKMKNNNKGIKVVYISNPMKVKTSASKFRALVQELTGQDAELPDPNKFMADTDEDVGGGNQTVLDAAKDSSDDHAQVIPRVEEQQVAGHHHHHYEQQYNYTEADDRDISFETFDEVFKSQMLENLTGFLPPGLLL